ncbi:PREDICTED: metastasis-suppressor KiSS-1 [Elephantulus edwardii]|uniref:metastasis-suppressor KiSS-1 n=1 Tax=Elephantulus edwardii TaxID=28737 RepID=UPI0003F0EEC5|nr:PREDICTED: metastasis-suppressor KiSS-1 [Elephantulus edwardii]
MSSLVSWKLLLFLCATSFGETSGRMASAKDPQSRGRRFGPLALQAPWEQRCAEEAPGSAGLRPRSASLCPHPDSPAEPRRPGLCDPRSRLIPSPRGAVLVQREKDLSAYNWNSFGLRYGKRRSARQAWRERGAGRG